MQENIKITLIHTPMGILNAYTDESYLYLLKFADQPDLNVALKRLKKATGAHLAPGITSVSARLQEELAGYFKGTLTEFTIPLGEAGTLFQKKVWSELQKITYGTTTSYAGLAQAINYPTAFRAAARANATNPFIIIVPCHRVINLNGNLGGYAGGVQRKEWLLQHERVAT
jgi:AraC family transcriptional regulator of adaptative response/methylated-DNA-[protein]-cysteine methyltransferase